MILGKNFHCFHFFFSNKISLEKMCHDILDKKQAFADCKKKKKSPNWIFPKGLVHDFGQKFQISSMFIFGQSSLRNSIW